MTLPATATTDEDTDVAPPTSRTTAAIPPMGAGDAGPLSLEETSRTGRDILMTREDRWVTSRTGITDPGELHQELAWFHLANPSGSVTHRVLERTLVLRERPLDALPDLPPPSGPQTSPGATAEPQTTAADSTTPPDGPARTPRVTGHVTDPGTARCPTCRAAAGRPCKTPSGKTAAQSHRARAHAAAQLCFDDVGEARRRGITVEQLHARRQEPPPRTDLSSAA